MQNHKLYDEIYNACFLFCPINLYETKIPWKVDAALVVSHIITDNSLKTTLTKALEHGYQQTY